jgi:hypothetical protein
MSSIQVVPAWRKLGVIVTALIVAVAVAFWAKSTVFAAKSTAGVHGPVQASAPMSPMDLMKSRSAPLPIEYYSDPF